MKDYKLIVRAENEYNATAAAIKALRDLEQFLADDDVSDEVGDIIPTLNRHLQALESHLDDLHSDLNEDDEQDSNE